jgi:hypothetical protein
MSEDVNAQRNRVKGELDSGPRGEFILTENI